MDKTAIVFTPGCYGNFVHWCIEYFSGSNIGLPFNLSGNSHKKIGHYRLLTRFVNFDLDNILEYEYCDILFGHPKNSKKTNLKFVFEKLLEKTNRKIIFLNCTDNSVLLNINNKFTKIYDNGWLDENKHLFLDNIKHGYSKNLNDLDSWELREFLSFYIFKQHEIESEYKTLDLSQNDRILSIPIENLINNFKHTIINILNFINLNIQRHNFEEIYSKWIKLQYYKDSDKLSKQIVSAIINDEFLDWSDKTLSIVDEAWIQQTLRDLYKIEIKCWNLNKFFTNTNELKSTLIYQNT